MPKLVISYRRPLSVCVAAVQTIDIVSGVDRDSSRHRVDAVGAKDPIVSHFQFVSALYKLDELSRRTKTLGRVRTGFSVLHVYCNRRGEQGEDIL
jgi:hypothetical protein